MSTSGGLYALAVRGCPKPTTGEHTPADRIVRLSPHTYTYILETGSGLTRLLSGPQRYTLADSERVLLAPTDMLVVPPMHYLTVQNPVMRDDHGSPLQDGNGQARLRYGDLEVRVEVPEPFPLYPGEVVVDPGIVPLRVVPVDQALRLRAVRDLTNPKRKAGELWLFQGPGTYVPRAEVEVVEVQKAVILGPDEGLVLRARVDFVDRSGKARKAGEQWLVRAVGSFMPRVEEEIVKHVQSVVLTQSLALHLRADTAFTDAYGKSRRAGEEWLVTHRNAECHIPDVPEVVVKKVPLTVLRTNDYAVVVDPWIPERSCNELGARKLVLGPATFFLSPGESLETNSVQHAVLLTARDALQVRAIEDFDDPATHKKRAAGSSWFVYGPQAYVPSVSVSMVRLYRSLISIEAIGLNLLFLIPATRFNK